MITFPTVNSTLTNFYYVQKTISIVRHSWTKCPIFLTLTLVQRLIINYVYWMTKQLFTVLTLTSPDLMILWVICSNLFFYLLDKKCILASYEITEYLGNQKYINISFFHIAYPLVYLAKIISYKILFLKTIILESRESFNCFMTS